VTNWKVFHLAYCKHLLKSNESEKRDRGIAMVVSTHVRPGMTIHQVSWLLHPVELGQDEGAKPGVYSFEFEGPPGYHKEAVLRFGGDGLLVQCDVWEIAE